MIENKIAELLVEAGIQWKTTRDGKEIHVDPDPEDVKTVLEHMTGVLATQPLNATMTVGGLIVEKKAGTHDVYVYLGEYT